MTCPLCGLSFDVQDAANACQGCPLASGCHLVRCPCCGYEWAEQSRLVHWWRQRRRFWSDQPHAD